MNEQQEREIETKNSKYCICCSYVLTKPEFCRMHSKAEYLCSATCFLSYIGRRDLIGIVGWGLTQQKEDGRLLNKISCVSCFKTEHFMTETAYTELMGARWLVVLCVDCMQKNTMLRNGIKMVMLSMSEN